MATFQRRARALAAVPDGRVVLTTARSGEGLHFEHKHEPGREGALDFTSLTELGVAVAGVPSPWLVLALVLTFAARGARSDSAFGETSEPL